LSENIGEFEETLRNIGFIVYREGARPPSEPVDFDDYSAVANDYGSDANNGEVEDDEDEAEDIAGDETEDYADATDMGCVYRSLDRDDIREDTGLVTAAFRAAGDPSFQDVRLKQGEDRVGSRSDAAGDCAEKEHAKPYPAPRVDAKYSFKSGTDTREFSSTRLSRVWSGYAQESICLFAILAFCSPQFLDR
jgi:hypothetical protein